MNRLWSALTLFPFCALLTVAQPATAQSRDDNWTTTWGAAPAGPPPASSLHTFTGQTVRLVVQASVGGNRVRIRLSNEMGMAPLHIGAARIGLRSQGSDLAPGTDRALRFGGRSGVTIPPGAPALSDPVELHLPPLAEVAVSLYFSGAVKTTTVHNTASQNSYVSAPGDFTASASLPVMRTIGYVPFVTALEVDGTGNAIVVLGDAAASGNRRWTDLLARRLQAERGAGKHLGLVNRSIGGNRLLANTPGNPLFGRSAQERFERDVLGTSGARYLMLAIGINDIANGGAALPTLEDLVAGYRQLNMRARGHRLMVIGTTLLPFEGAASHSAERETLRQAVNAWIRTGGEFDAVVDFDRAVRDPVRPGRLLPAYDSGDHLQPNDLGQQALANAVPFALFTQYEVAYLMRVSVGLGLNAVNVGRTFVTAFVVES